MYPTPFHHIQTMPPFFLHIVNIWTGKSPMLYEIANITENPFARTRINSINIDALYWRLASQYLPEFYVPFGNFMLSKRH